MRIVILPLAALTLIAADDPGMRELPLDHSAYSEPAEKWKDIEAAATHGVLNGDESDRLEDLREETCRDRITHAREAAGLPPLMQRQPASPDKPLAIYAVDRRQDGCSVMVMMGNSNDIRPLPARPEGPIALIPATTGDQAE